MKVFIDISSDKIGIYGLGNRVFLDRNGVETEIGKVLVDLDRQYGFTECIILNGPGGFTNLRVGTLALNLLKTLKNNNLNFYSLSKPELYSLFFNNGWIPRYGLLYIGQKSNIRVWDTKEKQLIKMIKKSEIQETNDGYGDIYLDQVYDETYFGDLEGKISYIYKDGDIILNFGGKHLLKGDVLLEHEIDKLDANYMIAPNIS